VVFRSKAQRGGNAYCLSKGCNAAAGHHGRALRVSLSAPMDCVAPLGKAISISNRKRSLQRDPSCEARLAMNADKATVS